MPYIINSGELYHHGVKGQKWGVRRYQNADGTLTEKGKARLAKYQSKQIKAVNKAYRPILKSTQKHVDLELKKFDNLDFSDKSEKNQKKIQTQQAKTISKMIDHSIAIGKSCLEEHKIMSMSYDDMISEKQKIQRGKSAEFIIQAVGGLPATMIYAAKHEGRTAGRNAAYTNRISKDDEAKIIQVASQTALDQFANLFYK